MSGIPFNKRPYDAFVSYSHQDGNIVDELVTWLRDVAGLSVWHDNNTLSAGARLSSALPAGIEQARATIFCVSEAWTASSWCEDEFGVALQERRIDPQYRLVGLHLDHSPVPSFLKSVAYIEYKHLEADVAFQLLKALASSAAPLLRGDKDIYISRTWHPGEAAEADLICDVIRQHPHGFRLIGDSPDYGKFDAASRIPRIIETCGALVAILPFRDDPSAGFTSKWMIEEIGIAKRIKVPYLIFASERVAVDPELLATSIGGRVFPLSVARDDPVLMGAVLSLEEAYRRPGKPEEACYRPRKVAQAFFATSIRNAVSGINRLAALIGHVTNMECVLGQGLHGRHAQQEIVDRIRGAQFVLADVTANHLNTLIEAGVARGADVPLHLISAVPASGDLKTRFMFSDLEINWYRNEIERIGVVHRIARNYRRRVYL